MNRKCVWRWAATWVAVVVLAAQTQAEETGRTEEPSLAPRA